MEPAIGMTVGRVIFSLVGRREGRFVALEIAGGLVFLAVCVYLLTIRSVAVRGIMVGSLFLVTGLLPRLILPRNPIEAPVTGESSGAVVTVGIIDFAWLAAMAGTLAIVVFANGSPPFTSPEAIAGLPMEYYTVEIENCRSLLSHTIHGFFGLAATLGVCMAILWNGEVWRKRGGTGVDHYGLTTLAAMKMVIAFLFIGFLILAFIGVPLYNRIQNTTLLLRN